MARILLVANRLPITLREEGGEVRIERSSGGLATGLAPMHEREEGLWLGWPGPVAVRSKARRAALSQAFTEHRLVPVSMSAEEARHFYESYCNGLLWPLFHSLLGQLPLESNDFPVYEQLNRRYADAVVAHYRPGDVVWIHDYHLLLLPRLLRQRLPDATIGFFLHIPFPPVETFRTLPEREQLLDGLLGADLIGFHTAAYARNFTSAVLHVLGVTAELDQLRWQGQTSTVGVFPMGVDAQGIADKATLPEVTARVAELRGGAPASEAGEGSRERLLLGIDRLDYTKGIPRRLLAYERLLELHPELHGKVRLVQQALPSRAEVKAYADFRQTVDGLVGRINGRFGTPTWTPVLYLYRSLSELEVIALYRAADVMLVTPLRDGMNLVSKEFVAARTDDDGVLVLSEFAGAAAELAEAIQVNPYDIERTAQAIFRALSLPFSERHFRMRSLRRRVFAYDVQRWSSGFLEALTAARGRASEVASGFSPRAQLDGAVSALKAAPKRVLLLDYDGTLVPLAQLPELAAPPQKLLELLATLAAKPATEVHVVSGRTHSTLERWLGHLPVRLHAEHGVWWRAGPGDAWEHLEIPAGDWRDRARAILDDFAARTPGSLVEEKGYGLAWHYRAADPQFGAAQANELRTHLASLFSNAPVEILPGSMVVELRPHGAHKGRVVERVMAGQPEGTLLLAIGDDRTDEDLFAALPPGAFSFRVGQGPSRAAGRLRSVEDVWALLGRL